MGEVFCLGMTRLRVLATGYYLGNTLLFGGGCAFDNK